MAIPVHSNTQKHKTVPNNRDINTKLMQAKTNTSLNRTVIIANSRQADAD